MIKLITYLNIWILKSPNIKIIQGYYIIVLDLCFMKIKQIFMSNFLQSTKKL